MAFTPTGVEFLAKNLNSYLRDLGKADKAQQGLGKSVTNVGSTFSKVGGSVAKFGALAAGAAVAGVGALAAGVGALGTVSVNTAISFEDAFAGVIKTTDGLTSEIGVLNEAGEELRAGFVDLSTEIPLAFEELTAIGELGGQLGIGKDALLDFTEAVSALGVSTNLSTEEAATGLARISNIFGVATEDMGENIEQLGSTLVDLGNNFATTERDILAFGERLAGAGNIAGLTQADVLSIGAAMSSVGVQAEAGGTATQKVLLAINNAVAGAATGFVDYSEKIDSNVDKLTDLNAESARLEAQFPGLQAELLAQKEAFLAAGGSAEDFGRQLGDKTRQKALEVAESIQELQTETDLLRQQHGQPVDSNLLATFAQTAGLSADEFKEAWQEDASEAFTMFVEGLGAQGDDAINTLEELGLTDQRLVRSFLSLAGAGDLLSQTLETGNQAFAENTALANEAAQRYATTRSQFVLLKNSLRAVADAIGIRLLPFVNRLIQGATGLIEDFSGPLTQALDERVVPALDNLLASAMRLFDAFQEGGGRGLLMALGFSEETIAIVEDIGGRIATFFDSTLPGILSSFQEGGATGIFQQMFNPELLESAIGNIIANLPTFLTNLIDSITAFLRANWPTISAALMEWGMQFWDWAQEAAVGAATALAGLAAAMIAWVTGGEGSEALNNLGEQIGRMIVTSLTGQLEGSEGTLKVMGALAAGLLAGVAGIVGTLIVAGGQIVAGIVSGILEALGIDLEPALFSELGAILSGIGENIVIIASHIGNQIILGISQGLLDAIASLQEAVGETVNGLLNRFRELLGIGSPSTVAFQFGVDIIQGMINGIKSLAGSLFETVGGIVGNLFGGDEEEQQATTFDPSTLDLSGFQAQVTQIPALIDLINQKLKNIGTLTLVTLTEQITAFTVFFTEQSLLIQAQILMTDQMIMNIYLITLVTLQAVTQTTSTIMIQAFLAVIPAVQSLITVITQLIGLLDQAAAAAVTMSEEMVSGFEDAEEAADELQDPLKRLITLFEKLEAAATRAAEAAQSVGNATEGLGLTGGIGAKTGLGLQGGLGLGFRVPGQGRGDTFGPLFLEPGEEVLVTPRGQTVEGVFFDRLSQVLGRGGGDRNNQFNLNVTTLSNARSVIQQFEVMRALVG